MDAREEKKKRLEELEAAMLEGDFWLNKERAQATLREITKLKDEIAGIGKYDKGDALLTVFSGAGGDDAEDFSGILFRMYEKLCERKGWQMHVLVSTPNDHGGYRNISAEISGKNVYGTLKNESGVHRLVRISPFSSKQLRHTSFSMVEVVPKFEKSDTNITIPDSELEVTTQKAGGPGGQNVNKRESAIRILHIPTKISVHVDAERSQGQNKEKAMELLRGKLYKHLEDERKSKEKGLYVSKTTSNEWGSQIRSYVIHPYKMVKDHRTDVETSQVDKVFEGEIDDFLEAEREM